jgi:hypothetical protein
MADKDEIEVPEEVRDVEDGRPKYVDKQSSTLDNHDDPFAPREGKTLLWKNVNMTLVRNTPNDVNLVLSG